MSRMTWHRAARTRGALLLVALAVAALPGAGTVLAPEGGTRGPVRLPQGAPEGRYLDLGRGEERRPAREGYRPAPRPWEREGAAPPPPAREPGRYTDLGALGGLRRLPGTPGG